jgi:MFS family permease
MAYAVLAGGVAALIPLFLTFRWSTAQRGHPEISMVNKSAAGGCAATGPDLRGALGTMAFWGMAFSFLCTSSAMFLVVLQTPAYLVETGYTPREAAEAFGLLGLLLPAGMIGFGWLGDRIGRPRAILISYSLTIGGIFALMMLARQPSPILLGLFVLMFGGTFGCRGPAMSTIAALIFRGAHFGRIYGFITLWMGLGGAGGAWLGGFLYDVTGNYETGFTLAMISLALGAAPFVLVPAIRRN